MTLSHFLESIFLFLIIVLIAVAIDLWLVRAWKRYREKRKRERKDESFIAASPTVDSSQKEPGPASLPSTPPAEGPSTEGQSAAGSVASPGPENAAPAGGQPVQPVGTETDASGPAQSDLSIQGKTGRVTHVQISMDIPEGETIQLTLESTGTDAFHATASKTGVTAGTAALPPKISAVGREPVPGPRARWYAPAAIEGRPASPSSWRDASRSILSSFVQNVRTSGRSLFLLALLIFLLTRLIGLTRFPIYFFTDEAVQTNFAAELAENKLTWKNGEFMPTFLENAGQYEMNISVYVQIIPYLLFGKSEFVTRGVSVAIVVFGMAALGLLLKRAFRLPLWWSGVLMLSIAPAWFVHSRTAFEPGESIAFYILFLYFYARYRSDTPWLLLPALFFGSLSAYTYSPSQVMVAVTGALLLITDIRYHWQHKKVALAGLVALVVFALPYFRFLNLHSSANKEQLEIVSSYWVRNIPFLEKWKLFFTEYLRGLDPRYWFLANPPEGVYHDIIRHLMKGYGHLFLWSLPFVVIGILLCLANIRSWPFRLVLISLLAAPTGGAIAQITITRALVMVVPASLLAALGISWVLALFERVELPDIPDFLDVWRGRFSRLAGALGTLRTAWTERMKTPGVRGFFRNWIDRARQSAPVRGIARADRAALALGLFAVLASINIYMLWDSLANGPTWYDNYTLYGMQYGGEQLTSAMVEYKQTHPEANLIVSPSWANGTDEIFRFFLPESFPYRTGTVEEYIQNYIPIADNDILIMTAEEYQNALTCGRFTEIRVDLIVNYPNGLPGFYFTHPQYIDNIQEIIAGENAELAKPVEEFIALGGETVRVVHSRFDMGDLTAAFDGESNSLIRTMMSNPMVLDFYFPSSHRFTSVTVRIGGAPTKVTATFYPTDGGDPEASSAEVESSSTYRDIKIQLSEPIESRHIRLEILTVGQGEPNHVHVYEIKLEGEGWGSGTVAPSA